MDCDLLSCGICYNRYNQIDRIPVQIPCGHTFCNCCIEKIKVNRQQNLPCPLCKTISSPNSGSKNIALLGLLDLDINLELSQCTEHKKIEELICLTCTKKICFDCMNEASHKNHNVETWSNFNQRHRKSNQQLKDAFPKIENFIKLLDISLDIRLNSMKSYVYEFYDSLILLIKHSRALSLIKLVEEFEILKRNIMPEECKLLKNLENDWSQLQENYTNWSQTKDLKIGFKLDKEYNLYLNAIKDLDTFKFIKEVNQNVRNMTVKLGTDESFQLFDLALSNFENVNLVNFSKEKSYIKTDRLSEKAVNLINNQYKKKEKMTKIIDFAFDSSEPPHFFNFNSQGLDMNALIMKDNGFQSNLFIKINSAQVIFSKVDLTLHNLFKGITADYAKKYSRRNLSWVWNYGTAEFKVTSKNRTYKLLTTIPQMAILLLFNTKRRLKFSEIKQILGADNKSALAKLIKDALGIFTYQYRFLSFERLEDFTYSDEILDNDCFTLLNSFWHQDLSLSSIPNQSFNPKENKEFNGNSLTNWIAGKNCEIDAKIVSVLKKRKSATLTEIHKEVNEGCNIVITEPKIIKKRIQVLIDRSFLETHSTIEDMYLYKP